MALRMLEIVVPEEDGLIVDQAFKAFPPIDSWRGKLDDGSWRISALLPHDFCDPVIDRIQQGRTGEPPFRVVILNVEAVVPRVDPSSTDATGEEAKKKAAQAKPRVGPSRVSREELYADIEKNTRLDTTFLALIILSVVVAAIGLIKGNVAVLVGAMVIAPLLGPNVGLILGTTLGDLQMVGRALRVNITGVALAFGLSLIIGFLLQVGINTEIEARTAVDEGDIILALASGAAGALAYTSGASSSLIGVMVAVALMPPLVVCGMLTAAGELSLAGGAALLLVTNVACVNLAGIATFMLLGVRPRLWLDAARARRATTIALVVWGLLLAVVIAAILISRHFAATAG